jgi:hypothetical protein
MRQLLLLVGLDLGDLRLLAGLRLLQVLLALGERFLQLLHLLLDLHELHRGLLLGDRLAVLVLLDRRDDRVEVEVLVEAPQVSRSSCTTASAIS